MSTASYMTVAGVAVELGVSAWLVRKAIREGRLRGYRIGGSRGPLRIGRSDFQAGLEAQAVEAVIPGQW